jgi:hypothetical protein
MGPSRRSRVYVPYLGAALTLALVPGLLGGIATAVSRLSDLPSVVSSGALESHRLAQTWGFIGLFVMGVSFRLLPVWSHSPLRFQQLASVLWVPIAGAVFFQATIFPQLSDDLSSATELGVAISLLVAALGYLIVVGATVAGRPAPSRRIPWALLSGAVVLLLAACARVLAASSEVFPYWTRNAESLLFLGGFVPAVISSVATRGFRKGPWGEGAFAVLAGGAAVALAACLIYLDRGGAHSNAAGLTGIAFFANALTWLALPLLSGIFDPAASRGGLSSAPHLLLMRSAFAWFVVAALIAAFIGFRGLTSGSLPDAAALDATRHALGMGAMVLIVGMGLLLLPQFALTPLHERRAKVLAVAMLGLLNIAAAARVAAALISSWDEADLASGLQAFAGVLATVALLGFAIALLTAGRLVRSERG